MNRSQTKWLSVSGKPFAYHLFQRRVEFDGEGHLTRFEKASLAHATTSGTGSPLVDSGVDYGTQAA